MMYTAVYKYRVSTYLNLVANREYSDRPRLRHGQTVLPSMLFCGLIEPDQYVIQNS